MKLLSILLSVVGVSGLVLVCPVAAEVGKLGEEEIRKTIDLNPSSEAADLIAQGVTRVTGVQIARTESGLELILKTAAGSERLVPLILPVGNDLVIDILDATLAFSIRNGVRESNPAPGIRSVALTKVDDSSIRLTITGEKQAPSAEVVPGRNDLVLSVTPEKSTAEQEPDEEIEVIATGSAEEDNYYVPDASRTLKTDTPLRDTPASVQVVPQEVIKDQGATSIREVVRNVSGVTFADSIGNRAERFNLRGFTAEQFLNGIRESTNNANRTQKDLANIDRIEILKGPASVLFGRAEPAGIINFVTKQPLLEPYYNLEFTAGNFDFYRPTIDISGPLTEDKKLAYRLNVAYENAGSFRDFIDTERIFVAPVLAWQIGDDTKITAEFSYLNDNRPIDRGLVVLSNDEVADIPLSRTFTNGEDLEYTQTKAALYLDHRFNSTLSLRSTFRYSEVDERGTDETDVEPSELLDDRNLVLEQFGGNEDNETYTFQNDLTAEFSTGSVQHTVLLGLEYIEENGAFALDVRDAGIIDIFNPDFNDIVIGDEITSVFEGDSDVSTFGIYLQDQITLLENLKVVIGGRFDTFSEESSFNGEVTETDTDAFSPRLGIVYQPIQPVSLYASYSRSFTPVGGTNIDNEPFDPQRGTGYEIGVKTEIIKDKLSSTLAFYDTTLTNVTTEDPNNPNFEVQTGEQNSQGIEIDISGEILPGWNVFAGYAYIDATVTEDNVIPVGNRLNNVPENNFNLWTTYTLKKGSLEGLGFGAGIFYVGERAGDLDNSFFLDDYIRVDAALFYEKENYRFALNFKNLFDAEYFEGSQDRLAVVPGAPFTIQGTVSVEF